MWMVNPRRMCRRHLLGEHVELHLLVSTINSGHSIAGYIKNNLLEPRSIKMRHEELVKEMKRRGYNHRSPLSQPSMGKLIPPECKNARVDAGASRKELIRRCPDCFKGPFPSARPA
jgi:hypothetical protein